MLQPTLPEIFPGVTQDIDTVTFPKSALRDLIALAENTPGQILAGINATCIDFYTPLRRDGDNTATPAVVGDKNVPIIAELGSRSISRDFDTGIEYEAQPVTLTFYKTSTGGGLVPNDY